MTKETFENFNNVFQEPGELIQKVLNDAEKKADSDQELIKVLSSSILKENPEANSVTNALDKIVTLAKLRISSDESLNGSEVTHQ